MQILPADDPLLREAMREAIAVEVEGQHVRVFSAEHLAAIALDTGRAKDKIRLNQFSSRMERLRSRSFRNYLRSQPGAPCQVGHISATIPE